MRKRQLLVATALLVLICTACTNAGEETSGTEENEPQPGEETNENDDGSASQAEEEPPPEKEEQHSDEQIDEDVTSEDEEEEIEENVTEEVVDRVLEVEGDNYVLESSEYGFSLDLLESWRDITTITESNDAPDTIRSFSIFYTPDHTIEQFFFSIDVLPADYGPEYLEGSPWIYLGSTEQYMFSYNITPEPTPEILEPENEDKLMEIQSMIQDELPRVIETFRIY
ncbi:hypothetical protein [Alteribacter aurantiacus]|uniref:hypothetical protein n=1 Tax=Alteribacter aurantiacus TaxID=254410 RepID=UPI0004097098|nr:hypothetical protein [Alteribacter aurantiacus]